MNKIRIYDWPTRVFHWFFAVLFVGAFAIAKLVDDESPLFAHHMLLGLLLACITLQRIIWSFLGTRYALASSLPLGPRSFVSYFREFFHQQSPAHQAHNPASAWGAILMILLALGLAATGYLMASGQKETFEDLHELLANAFAVTVLAHLLGLAIHQFKYRDGIGLSMIHGKKNKVSEGREISSNRGWVALGMIVVLALFALHLYGNFDKYQSTTRLFGTTLQLGDKLEAEEEKGGDL